MFGKRLVAAVMFLFPVLVSASYCPAEKKGREILVSAAISLKEAFQEISPAFEKQTGIQVRFNFGASGLLQKQIETGAPVDVFASAGEKQMDDLQAKGLILPESRRDFAANVLVLILPVHPKIALKAFSDLVRPQVERLAIGSPKTVPAGQYAEEALKNLKLWDTMQPRLVLAENVRQVLDYVTRGEVDAGIVYASDMAGVHGMATIAARAPGGSHSPIKYPVAVVKQTDKEEDAQRFIDFVLSGAGQSVLKEYGFLGSR
jgi:molybdate transport system substrate-binding protein